MTVDRVLGIVAGLLALLIAGLAIFWQPESEPRPLPRPGLAGGDFTLHTADGPVSLHDYRGKLVLLYFGYTYCPDVCPTALAAIGDGLRRLKPEEAARVAVLFISVDPRRDTPARLKEYAAFFHPAIVGATGSPQEVAEVARRYGIFYAAQKPDAAGNYAVDHASETLIVGADGRLAATIAHDTPPERVAETIRRLLQQS